jgi:hypothetical protein
MGIKELALSFENIIVSFCFLACLLLIAICNQSVSSSVIVYVLDSEVMRRHSPSENVEILLSNGVPTYVQWVRQF